MAEIYRAGIHLAISMNFTLPPFSFVKALPERFHEPLHAKLHEKKYIVLHALTIVTLLNLSGVVSTARPGHQA